jgi:hypothetical protein
MRDDQALVSSRRSRQFYTDAVPDSHLKVRLRESLPELTGYPWMFAEDVENGLLPWPHHHPFQAVLTGPDAESLMKKLTTGRRGARDLTDATHTLMTQALQVLLRAGVATFEVELLSASEHEAPTAIATHLLHPGSLEWRERQPVQLLPTDWEPAGYVGLDRELLMELRLPEPLATQIRDTMKFLTAVDESDRREFALMERSYRTPTHFSADAFHRIRRRLLIAGTAAIAWDGRGSFIEEVLDPYGIARALRFLRFKIKLRDALLVQINAYLIAAASRLHANAQLVLEHVPTEADVDEAEQALASGAASLSDLISFAIEQKRRTAAAPAS